MAPGCPVFKKQVRHLDGRRPRIHDMELAGDLILFVDGDAGLRPYHVIPIERTHPEKRRLRFLAVGVGRADGRHRHGERGGQNQGPQPPRLARQ